MAEEVPKMEGYMNTVYRGPEGESTQWQDIHRKLGNLPPKPPVWKPGEYEPEKEEVKDKEWLNNKDEEELRELEDEFKDDRFLEDYRRKRIDELQQAARKPRFGTVEEIRAKDFVQDVTNAGPDVWVVVHLYKEGHAGSLLVGQTLTELAAKYTSTKFLKIVSTDCIPNYPDKNLPTLLLYHDGALVQHLAGIAALGGPRTTPEQVVLVLNKYGSFCHEADEDVEAGQQAQVRSLVKRMLEQRIEQTEHDESSDFDD